MGGVESTPKPVSEGEIRECAMLNLNAYKRNPNLEKPFDHCIDRIDGYTFQSTATDLDNRADLYLRSVKLDAVESRSLVIVFPGSECVGHWIHNFFELFGVGFGIGNVVHASQVRALVDQLLNRQQVLLDDIHEITVVGHSRGGIQACLAVEYLKSMKRANRKDLRFSSISLISFGAPLFPIDHGVCKYLTQVEMTSDPIPGWSALGIIFRLPISIFTAYPGYSQWKVKYDTSAIQLDDLTKYHLMEFYADFIANNHPQSAYEGFVSVS